LDQPGYDLTGVVVGSEGLLGIVTEVTLRILRKAEATRTFFATFPSTTEAGNAVSAIIASGIVPAAIEMMDTLAIVAAKAATGVDWPEVGAALLMDVDGVAAECEHTSANAIELARNAGALVICDAREPGEEKKAEEMSGEILRICLRYGGSITGEHGVGADKAPYMSEMFSADDLETMQLLRCAFDPLGSFNPGKVFPSPRL